MLTPIICCPIFESMDISKILSALLDAGMTQANIGERIGISQSSISDILNRKIGICRPSHRVVAGLISLSKERRIYMKIKEFL